MGCAISSRTPGTSAQPMALQFERPLRSPGHGIKHLRLAASGGEAIGSSWSAAFSTIWPQSFREVPGSRLIAAGRRRRPYVFSDEEMTTLINAASRPNPRVPFRPIVLSTLLGLLASTGLRVAEACRLSLDNVRLGDDHPNLQILQTKFHKSRIVPIHSTVVAALSGYLDERHAHKRDTWGDRLFVNRDGRPLDVHDLGHWFASLCQSLGIEPANTHDRRPCLTSFRHTFAVRRLREWHSAGLDVQSLLPTLAVYLGHVGPESSYW